MRIIAIDPGKRTGYAVLVDWRLEAFGTESSTNLHLLPPADLCIVEMPRVFTRQDQWKGDPQQIVELAFLAGRIAAQYPRFIAIESIRWKGSLDKKPAWAMTRRARLTPDEATMVENRRTSEHARDAIGIAAWYRDHTATRL